MKLRSRFGDSSIRFKLSFLVLLNGSFALLLAGVFLFGYERFEARQAATRELATQAAIVADSSTAAVSFGDDHAATDSLTALRSDPNLVEATILDRNNRVLGRFRRFPKLPQPDLKPRPDGIYDLGSSLEVVSAVRLGGERIGTVVLRASTAEVTGRLNRYSGVVSLVLLVSLGLALLLSSRAQRSITEPIAQLSTVARSVSTTKDYSVRARRDTQGEIGFLIDSFNEMLTQIEQRDEARRGAEELLRESEERYALAARGANDGLWDWKLSTGEIYFSPRWSEMLGYAETERWSGPEDWFSRIHPADRERVRAEISAHRKGATAEFVSEYRMRQKNGGYVWMLSRGIAVRDANGIAVRMAGSQTDITAGKVADPLTGLPNRLYFLDRLESSLEAARHQDTQFAVLFLDLDRFKLVNDSLGHAAGDELLEEIAERLLKTIPGSSLGQTSGGAVLARIGGDEFAVLLPRINLPVEATLVAELILQALTPAFQIAGRQIFASVSIGIAMSSSGDSPEQILRNADTAMYHAKTAGKARFEVFDEGMREQAIARLEIETELRGALETGAMLLYYQPQFSIGSNRITGCETLIRWLHPERGMIQPSEFIPIAEETELIIPLGRWVLQEACRQMAAWQRDCPLEPALTISVNVSFKQLAAPAFVEEVARILADSGLCPGTLKLEITESAVMANPQETIDTLRKLRDLQIGLEIDDFGTGYSSLSYLSRLPFETVKIDRSFINDLGNSEESWEIVRTIVDLARSMGMDVVAEGVETPEQLQTLTWLGCARVQGYYFSLPVTAADAGRMFQIEALKRACAKPAEQGFQIPDPALVSLNRLTGFVATGAEPRESPQLSTEGAGK